MKINFIKDRNKYLQKMVADKEVLHYGCFDYGISLGENLHDIFAKSAKKLVGVEIDREAVKEYSKTYPNLIEGDVTKKLPVKDKFDFVIAGEIIEHVTNFGDMLKFTKDYLKKNGKLVITTPNAYNYRNIMRQFLFNNVIQHEEHVCIFDKETIKNALERHGYEVSFFSYLYVVPKPFLHRILDYIFCRLKKSFAPNILVIANLKKNKIGEKNE